MHADVDLMRACNACSDFIFMERAQGQGLCRFRVIVGNGHRPERNHAMSFSNMRRRNCKENTFAATSKLKKSMHSLFVVF